jgi:hypothetical protein
MTRPKIKVTNRPVEYADERLTAFTDDSGRGGLIAFRSLPDDPTHPLRVEVYRTDPGVLVSHTTTDHDGRPVPGDMPLLDVREVLSPLPVWPDADGEGGTPVVVHTRDGRTWRGYVDPADATLPWVRLFKRAGMDQTDKGPVYLRADDITAVEWGDD